MAAPRRPEAEHHYPCASCGADLRFAPGQERLVCDYCGHVQEIPQAVSRGGTGLQELPLAAALGADVASFETEEHRTLHCPNCGASIEMDGPEHAVQCPFCATPVVTDTGAKRLLKPQGLVPFAITEAEARAALGRWLGSLWFAPSGFAQYARKGRRMTGIYTPFWTFDAATETRYSGARGDYWYETRSVQVMVDGRAETRTEEVRHTRWTPVSGRVARVFDDVLIYAARSLPPAYVQGLAPWDLAGVTEYRPDYLAGFSAEGYTVELAEGHHLAQAEMIRVIQSDVRRDIGGDEQRIGHLDPSFAAETFKHILLPVWTAAYKYRGRSFRFVVNAQTGKVQGDRPWSAWKIATAVVLAIAVAALIAYLGPQAK